MSPRLVWALAACSLLAGRLTAATATKADIDSPEKRRQVVEMAEQLTRPPVVPIPMVAESSPFNPPGFSTPDADEKAAARLAAAQNAAATGAKVAEVRTDKETLEKIAEKLVPSGTIMVGGTPRLMFGKKFFKVGTHFTVTFDGADYDLILTSIDATTFSLRLNKEVTTRPIQTGK
jgi:hypothetical protein